MLELVLGLAGLIAGLVLLAYSGDKAVEHSAILALKLGIPPLMIGLLLVSLGTDLPEIVNSIISSALGHGDINVGHACIGSCLVDACFSIGIGPLIFPVQVTANLVVATGLYAIFVSAVVTLTLTLREKVDKITGAFFIFLYLLSYITLSA